MQMVFNIIGKNKRATLADYENKDTVEQEITAIIRANKRYNKEKL